MAARIEPPAGSGECAALWAFMPTKSAARCLDLAFG
jgi:hypothetical protein